MRKYYLAASIICSDIKNLTRDIELLEGGEIDYIHFDVMDGVFVPRFGLYPEILASIKSLTTIPIDVHLMIEDPIPYIKTFADAGADSITVHAESTPHLHRAVKMIKDLNLKAGIGLNHSTPLSVLDYLLDDINMVLVMAINPGIVGHKVIPSAYKKISDLRAKLSNYPDILIEVDGGVTFDSAQQMVGSGAHILVCGSGTIFKPINGLTANITELRSLLD